MQQNKTAPLNIALAGCGKMGTALLRGWIKAGTASQITILDPEPPPQDIMRTSFITHTKTAENLLSATPDILMLAVKPQIMDEVCRTMQPILSPDIPVLSIAAGRTLQSFANIFGQTQPVIRSMPNTPATIGKGITVACAGQAVTDRQKDMADTLLTAAGKTEWITEESLLDAVTALSGSGPAYLFLLIETLAEAGRKAGLKPDFAMRLARQTVIGSAALAEQETDIPAQTLRENVTSPGGTTAAALEILMNGQLQNLFDGAINAAAARSRKLSG